jgi:glycosyltransferase involved in cell wall biosynthesis
MRITFVTPVAEMSGGARVIHIYAKALKERGHDVCVVTRPMVVPLRRRMRSLLSGRGLPPRLSTSPTHYNAASYDYRIAGPFRPIEESDVPDADVVIATWWETAEWVEKYPPSKGKKVHFVQHYEAFPGQPKDRVDAVLRLPTYKITISAWLNDLLRNKFGAAQVAVVLNSVDLKQFDAPPRGKHRRPTVGLLYSPHPIKDCSTGFRAFALLKEGLPDAQLVAFGKTPPAISLPLPSGTSYTLLPPQDRMRDIYASCDVWLLSSATEGFSLPFLEAMACRCPIVATMVGGPVDIITEGVEGFLAPVGGARALAEKLKTVLSLPEAEWRKMSDAAYAKATGYSWNDAVDRFEAALNEAARLGDQPMSDAAELERRSAEKASAKDAA